MSEFFPVYIYLGLTFIVTLLTLGVTGIFPSIKDTKTKFAPYESGIKTEAHLLDERFPLRHYLVALIFLVFDVEVIFMYPRAVIAKSFGSFAFYEMLFFLVALLPGFVYVWQKGGLQWE